MGILNVNTIQPVSTGTTVTVSNGDLVVGTGLTIGRSGVITATTFSGAHSGDGSNLTDIPGANITGTIPQAALTNATVDLTGIRKDIATLALQVAVDTNRAAYNLTDTFIDQFENDSALATQTNCDRLDDEFMATKIPAWGNDTEWKEGDLDPNRLEAVSTNSFSGPDLLNGQHSAANIYGLYINSPSGFSKGFIYQIGADADFGINTKFTGIRWSNCNTAGRFQRWQISVAQDGSNYTIQDASWGDSSSEGASNIGVAANSDTWNKGTLDNEFVVTNTAAKVRVLFDGFYNNGNANAGISEIRLYAKKYTPTSNSTGTVISTSQTASSARTKVSGVFLYKDAAGTATLGTDLKLYVTCNGGTNWTEVTSSDMTTSSSNFSTGIKTVYFAEKTCTSGTSIKYKVEWANQADGSKETQLHGIALNY